MSQERQFLDTLFQPRFRVLGRSLLPMEVGHWLLLSKMGRLCLPRSDGVCPGSGDLAMAVYVTTRPHWVAVKDACRADLWFRTRLLFLTKVGQMFQHSLEVWREYVRWNMDKPIYREISSNAGSGPAVLNQPFWLAYLRRAKASGMSERDALSQRIKTVLWESVAVQEEMGRVVWCSEEEMAVQEHILKMQQQSVKEPPQRPEEKPDA